MDSGYYAACAGLAAQTQALELVANNLANLGTAGFPTGTCFWGIPNHSTESTTTFASSIYRVPRPT
jgi:flagellar hook protein FlgE